MYCFLLFLQLLGDEVRVVSMFYCNDNRFMDLYYVVEYVYIVMQDWFLNGDYKRKYGLRVKKIFYFCRFREYFFEFF